MCYSEYQSTKTLVVLSNHSQRNATLKTSGDVNAKRYIFCSDEFIHYNRVESCYFQIELSNLAEVNVSHRKK